MEWLTLHEAVLLSAVAVPAMAIIVCLVLYIAIAADWWRNR